MEISLLYFRQHSKSYYIYLLYYACLQVHVCIDALRMKYLEVHVTSIQNYIVISCLAIVTSCQCVCCHVIHHNIAITSHHITPPFDKCLSHHASLSYLYCIAPSILSPSRLYLQYVYTMYIHICTYIQYHVTLHRSAPPLAVSKEQRAFARVALPFPGLRPPAQRQIGVRPLEVHKVCPQLG